MQVKKNVCNIAFNVLENMTVEYEIKMVLRKRFDVRTHIEFNNVFSKRKQTRLGVSSFIIANIHNFQNHVVQAFLRCKMKDFHSGLRKLKFAKI